MDFPISDFAVPHDKNEFLDLVTRVDLWLKDGETILIHCAAGIGRTGVFASCLLQAMGLSVVAANARVAAAGSGAETQVQRDFVEAFLSPASHKT